MKKKSSLANELIKFYYNSVNKASFFNNIQNKIVAPLLNYLKINLR